jgi:hypothetical protein
MSAAPRLKTDLPVKRVSNPFCFANRSYTNSLSKTVLSVKPLFKRFKGFKRFEKSLYGLKRPIFESELVLDLFQKWELLT